MMKVSVFDEPSVYKKILLPSAFLCKFGLPDIPFYTKNRSILFYRDQAFLISTSENRGYTRTEVSTPQVENRAVVVLQGKIDARIGQGNPDELILDMPELY